MNGQEVSVAGQVELELHVGDEKLSHLFVVADIVDTILLGFDFLKRFRCSLDFDCMQLQVGHSVVEFVSDTSKVRQHKSVGVCTVLGDSLVGSHVSSMTACVMRGSTVRLLLCQVRFASNGGVR